MKYIYCILNNKVDNVIAVDNPAHYIQNCQASLSRFDKIIVKDREHEAGDPGNMWDYDSVNNEFVSPDPQQSDKSQQIANAIKDLVTAINVVDPATISQAITDLIVAEQGIEVKAPVVPVRRINADDLLTDKALSPEAVDQVVENFKAKREGREPITIEKKIER